MVHDGGSAESVTSLCGFREDKGMSLRCCWIEKTLMERYLSVTTLVSLLPPPSLSVSLADIRRPSSLFGLLLLFYSFSFIHSTATTLQHFSLQPEFGHLPIAPHSAQRFLHAAKCQSDAGCLPIDCRLYYEGVMVAFRFCFSGRNRGRF